MNTNEWDLQEKTKIVHAIMSGEEFELPVVPDTETGTDDPSSNENIIGKPTQEAVKEAVQTALSKDIVEALNKETEEERLSREITEKLKETTPSLSKNGIDTISIFNYNALDKIKERALEYAKREMYLDDDDDRVLCEYDVTNVINNIFDEIAESTEVNDTSNINITSIKQKAEDISWTTDTLLSTVISLDDVLELIDEVGEVKLPLLENVIEEFDSWSTEDEYGDDVVDINNAISIIKEQFYGITN